MEIASRPPGGIMPTINAPRAPVAGTTTAAQRAAAQNFEGQVLGALLQPMFSGLDSKGLFSGGPGEAQWRPMLVQEMGNAVARQGGLGLAASVLRDMQRNSR